MMEKNNVDLFPNQTIREVHMQYVVVGNGIAGISAAEAVRQLDPSGHVTLIGDETAIPYSWPMISMVLDGSIPLKNCPSVARVFTKTSTLKHFLETVSQKSTGNAMRSSLKAGNASPLTAFSQEIITFYKSEFSLFPAHQYLPFQAYLSRHTLCS